MRKENTTDQIVTAYRLINTAKLTKMEDSEKFALIKIMRQLKRVGIGFDDFLKDVQEKLEPDGFKEIASKAQAGRQLTADESATFAKYDSDVRNCLRDELEKTVTLDFEPLTEEAVGRLIASNDFSVNEIMAITDVIGA